MSRRTAASSGTRGRSAATASAVTSTISNATNTSPQPNATAPATRPRAGAATVATNQTKNGADAAKSAQPIWICVWCLRSKTVSSAPGASNTGRSPITSAPATNSPTATSPLILRGRLLPRPEQRHRVLHALQLLLAREGPRKGVLGLVVHRLRDQHAPGPGNTRQPRRHVHRPPVPVAAAADRLAARHARAQHREVLSLVVRRTPKTKSPLNQTRGIRGHEHRGAADRLPEPTRPARQAPRQLAEPARHATDLLRRQLLPHL